MSKHKITRNGFGATAEVRSAAKLKVAAEREAARKGGGWSLLRIFGLLVGLH